MGGFYLYGIDPWYLYLLLPAIVFAIFSQIKVKSTFSKFSQKPSNLTGAEAAQKVLDLNGVTGVKIEYVNGNLTDHYDPKTNVIRLSDSVFNTRSVSAVGVAAHEAGHAVQYAKSYFPIKARSVILPVCNLGSQLSLPLILIGMIFSFPVLIKVGIIFFAAALIFQLVTLPVEFNASKRAVVAIRESGLLDNESVKGAKKVLTAAAMTYIAAFFVSLMQLIRLIAISNRRR